MEGTHRQFSVGFSMSAQKHEGSKVQITIILGIFLALLAGELAGGGRDDEQLRWLSYLNGPQAAALMAGVIFLMWSLMRVVSGRVVAKLKGTELPQPAALRLPGRVDFLMRMAVLGAFAVQLVGGWAHLICGRWRLQRFVLADEILLILPFLVLVIMQWYCFYPVNRYMREYVITGQLAEGLSARPVWRRSQYVSFHVRGGMLIILVPLLLMLTWKDLVDWAVGRWFPASASAWWPWVITAAGAGAIFILAPLLLRLIWLTRTLPSGPLRVRLEAFCERMRLKYRDILLWDTYSAVANAAVMGLWRPVRYVLLSDALIENLSDEQIEAVFGHEAGHVRHHHIVFLVLFVLGGGLIVMLLTELLALALSAFFNEHELWGTVEEWLVYGWSLGLLAGWMLVFGWVSRRFERQADVHAAQVIGLGEEEASVRAGRLSARGARIMGSALLRIAVLNGISTEARSWRHSSIASRAEFLRQLAEQKGALARFMRLVLVTKIMILAAVAVGGGFLLVGLLAD
ncbi:MAG: hypothetical protein AMJ79_11560 [Phycisphaerae bacterium SM23_30]|nr:MAG: hypothetical protein AMJ79_11560 [Phycisphaerae bacterium SM23_30]